jgi:hypothetical protein
MPTMDLALAAISGLILVMNPSANQSAGVPVDPSILKGTVGVCVRWGADPHHVAEAVVVVGSGNAALDEATPRSVEGMTWERPTGAQYHGEWVGITLSFDEPATTPAPPLPSCASLKMPPPNV